MKFYITDVVSYDFLIRWNCTFSFKNIKNPRLRKFLTRCLCYLFRNTFIRISDDLDLFVKDGQNRPIYVYRHSFISDRRRKGVDANIVALHSNTSVQMINQHYQDMSDDHLLEIHNKVFPNRTKNPNYKVITKKS